MAQIAPVLGDLQRNLALHLEQIEAARRQHADLIVFPELSLTGYFVRDMVPDVAISPAGPEIRAADRGGRRRCRWWWASSRSRRGTASTTPRSTPKAAGSSTSTARSICPPTGCSTSSATSPPASGSWPSTRRGSAASGILICEDFWHLSAAAIMQAEEVDLLICMANSPARGVDGPKIRTAETYEQLAKAFAQLLGAAVIVVNRVGFEDGLCFWGGSMAVGPDGRMIAQAPMLDEALTRRRVRSGRAAPPAADHAAGPRRAAAVDDRRTQPHQAAPL